LKNAQVGFAVIEEDIPGRHLGFDSFRSWETEDISSSRWTWTYGTFLVRRRDTNIRQWTL
jgi:hypothetical protein